MNPLTGLMKMLEMGMEKGGIRDSMATRQANAASQAVDMTQNPYMF